MTNPLRVMMLIQSFHLHSHGGAERQLAALAPLLQERGVEVHVLTRRRPGRTAYEKINGVSVYRMPTSKYSVLSSLFFTVFGLAQIYRVRPHILHAHGLFSPTTTAIMARRMFGIPVVAKALRGGTLGDVIRVKSKPMGRARIANLRENVDGFITISQEIQNELVAEDVSKDKCHYIPNGVDVERFKPLLPDQKQQQRRAMSLPEGPIVVYVGRLVPEKRVNNLIESWSSVHQHVPNALLLIIGQGREEVNLQQMAGQGIHFVGYVDRVQDWLQVADVYVLPSVSEGLSNSLLEAMATGLPIIATAVGDAPILIAPQQNGWCIPPDDVTILAEALLAALRNLDQCRPMGEHNRDLILREFQLSATADKLVRLYNEVRR